MKKITLRAIAFLTPLFISGVAFAQDGYSGSNEFDATSYKALAAGLAIGIAAFGGALGQGRAAQAALEGIARNPSAADKMFTPLILSLALIESLVIYALLIAGGFIGPLGN
ncbi:MAG: F-type H+-transporting ATPase subunit c [Polyangiales bacterium]|jgi:F-type H+-transporting ATPase subunit c